MIYFRDTLPLNSPFIQHVLFPRPEFSINNIPRNISPYLTHIVHLFYYHSQTLKKRNLSQSISVVIVPGNPYEIKYQAKTISKLSVSLIST